MAAVALHLDLPVDFSRSVLKNAVCTNEHIKSMQNKTLKQLMQNRPRNQTKKNVLIRLAQWKVLPWPGTASWKREKAELA